MTEAPAELWMQLSAHDRPRWHETSPRGRIAPAAVRYVRADLYEALQARLAVVRSWGEAPCLEPLKSATIRPGAAEGRF